MNKLTVDEFGKLQRLIMIRNKCQEVRHNLRLIKGITNGRWYDVKEFEIAENLVDSIEEKAIYKLERCVR